MYKIIAVGVVSFVAMGSAAFAALDSRGAIEQSVTGTCQASQEDCMTTINTLIAGTVQCLPGTVDVNERCGCAPNRNEVIQGLGDAAMALSKTNIEISRLIYSAVGGAPACYADAGVILAPVGGSPG